MKISTKLYIFSGLIFAFALFLAITSLKNMSVSSIPFEATVEKAEHSDISGYEYFKLSEGYILPFASFCEIEKPSNEITQVVYPFVSAAYLEKARSAYLEQYKARALKPDFAAWFETYKVKPKFYVQAEMERMSEGEMGTRLLADSLAKKIEGTRIRSYVSISRHITSEYKKQGITTENSVFIDEGSDPAQEKETARIVLTISVIIALVAAVLFIIGWIKAKRIKKLLGQIQSYKQLP